VDIPFGSEKRNCQLVRVKFFFLLPEKKKSLSLCQRGEGRAPKHLHQNNGACSEKPASAEGRERRGKREFCESRPAKSTRREGFSSLLRRVIRVLLGERKRLLIGKERGREGAGIVWIKDFALEKKTY